MTPANATAALNGELLLARHSHEMLYFKCLG
eukprot:CAMPEP_0197890226 /NCGR_PEP_ID=MMETSP1439-20131203/25877_1 /TAXON_ID=66791 /ORGANISM="Gonyaulax spinifera, Strain CCMP409" /LENGTH=30 /DNA_ID= /DNA_START= /DNA_END= /DNA_ORIENTATION=